MRVRATDADQRSNLAIGSLAFALRRFRDSFLLHSVSEVGTPSALPSNIFLVEGNLECLKDIIQNLIWLPCATSENLTK